MSPSNRIARLAIFIILALLILGPRAAMAVTFSAGAEIGHGFRHNDDSRALFLRGMFLGDGGAGCGVTLGTWDGEFKNDVAGLSCEKRFWSEEFQRHSLSIGAGVVDIDRSELVNTDWALELHIRLFVSKHFALAVTHLSNAGAEQPNKGFNFVSLEIVF
jgi:hypothetical protein